MRRIARHLLHSTSGSSAAEFGLVLPLFLVLTLGIVDAGRFIWEYNEAEKATQVGARVAIVTDALPGGLVTEDYAGQTVAGETLNAGDPIPAGALGSILCTDSGCNCEQGPCPADLGTMNDAQFNDILVARMQKIYPAITAANVEVRYSGSGFGFAQSDSGGGGVGGGGGGGGSSTEQMEISPLVTVTLTGLEFQPVTSLLFAPVPMPSFSTTLTSEDASGQVSN
jgi:hypothetical protein